jgi:tetratricopeptide (TPR) repeat protein
MQDPGPTPEVPDARKAIAAGFIEQANSCDPKNTKCRLTAFAKAVEAAPDLPEGYYGRALVYKNSGDLDRAASDLDRVIELDPRSAGAYFNRAGIRASKNELALAIEDYNKVIELLPESVNS